MYVATLKFFPFYTDIWINAFCPLDCKLGNLGYQKASNTYISNKFQINELEFFKSIIHEYN